MKVMQNIISNK